ncbi:hypothetical protein N824_05480 [Pedobacter sp. V48]|nr:hypothetical protein N824_05480 [Pedobacter sp. V48]
MAQQPGSITGKITTSDGHNAAFVSVKLIGTPFGATTNEKGDYEINKVNPGKYTIRVSAIGLSPQEKTAEVTESASTKVDFVLRENLSTLEEVNISTNAKRYKVDQPSSSLRLNQPLLEIPQNIQIVTSSALADQQIISMSDGLIRNVSGAVRLEHWGDLYTNITMRGSQIQALRNGFNVVSSYWGPLTEDMSFVDHIEFVKGPAGFMVSNGDPSGLYNVVTKKPTGQEKGQLSLTTGSFGLYRAEVDLDGKLNKSGKLLYRLNLAGQNKKSFRDYESNNRYSIAPVVSYQIDDKTKLTAEYALQHAAMTNVGSFYVFATDGYAKLPRNFTQVAPGLPLTKINDHSLFLNLTHEINDNWKITAAASYFNYQQNGSSMWPTKVNDNGTLIRNVGIWDAKSEMTMAQGFINGTVVTGAVRHRILAGFDLGNKNYFADWGQSHDLDTEASPFDNSNPNYGVPSNGFPQFDRSLNLEARATIAGGVISQEYSSLYAQDELGFIDNKLRLTLAGRYTYVKQFYFGSTSGKKFTPRAGLSYTIDSQTSVYGLYDQSFVPQTAGRLLNGGAVKPITGNNVEFGIKKDWGKNGSWNTTLAVYRILKNNEAQAEPNPQNINNPKYFLLGQKRAQGIEFDIRGEIISGLTLTANYALTDSRVNKVGSDVPSDLAIAKGDIVPGYAKHTTNAWLSYKLQNGVLKGTGISAGFTHLANRETDSWSESDVRLPNYFKVDGGLFWENSKLRLNANVFNIFDKYLYTGSYYSWLKSFYWQAEAPRNYRLSLSYKF